MGVVLGRILAPSVLLVIFGLLALFSVAPSLLPNQFFFFLLGLAFFFTLSQTDYRVFLPLGKFFFFLSLFLLFSLFLFAPRVRGTVRWFELGPFQFQPSEISKPLLILFFASILSKKEEFSLRSFFSLFTLILLPVGLVVKEPDLGTGGIFLIVWLGMMIAAGCPLKIIFIFSLLVFPFLSYFWQFLKGYQKLRILSFLNPHLDPLGTGYNVIQAQIAIGSGRIFGKGLGFGTQSHLRFLPERYSDFVFATLAEEIGFLGSMLLLTIFFFLIYQIFKIAQKTNDSFGSLLCIGIGVQLLVQVFVNIGMNLGIVPITGVTLPFVSYGGSSLVSSFIALGLVASVGKRELISSPVDIHFQKE